MTRQVRFLLLHLVAAAVLLGAGLMGVDRWIAEGLHAAALERLWLLDRGTTLLDTVSGKEISKFLPGMLLMAGAAIAGLARRQRASWSLLFVGLSQLCATLVAGVSKNLFGRLRPFQLLENTDWSHAWFVGGSSFPSGHAGFYFGLFLPLAWLFPRWRVPLVLAPWFIAVARVNANDHFLSDVAASIIIAALFTWLFARWVLSRAEGQPVVPRVPLTPAA